MSAAPLVRIPAFTFLLVSLTYHSDMILMNGANSNVSGLSLSIRLFTTIKRTLFLRKISIAFPKMGFVKGDFTQKMKSPLTEKITLSISFQFQQYLFQSVDAYCPYILINRHSANAIILLEHIAALPNQPAQEPLCIVWP